MLGATEPTASAVSTTLAATDPVSAQAAARQAESEWLEALAEIGKAQVNEVGATQRAELVSGEPIQKLWRPLFALELTLLECPAFTLTLLHALWTGHVARINGFASLSALLMTYFGAGLSLLGIYVNSRGREKEAGATGQVPPTLIGSLVKALTNKKE